MRAGPFRPLTIPPKVARHLPPGTEAFVHSVLPIRALRSQENGRWHLSVSHERRVPRWGEIGEARDHLIPEHVWMMIPHPPRKFWLNMNEHVLHLWEFRDEDLIEQFQEEGEFAQRMGFGTPTTGEPT